MFSLIHKNKLNNYVPRLGNYKISQKKHSYTVLIIQVFYDHAGNSDDSKAVKPALPKN